MMVDALRFHFESYLLAHAYWSGSGSEMSSQTIKLWLKRTTRLLKHTTQKVRNSSTPCIGKYADMKIGYNHCVFIALSLLAVHQLVLHKIRHKINVT
jgi:hypothetical protein